MNATWQRSKRTEFPRTKKALLREYSNSSTWTVSSQCFCFCWNQLVGTKNTIWLIFMPMEGMNDILKAYIKPALHRIVVLKVGDFTMKYQSKKESSESIVIHDKYRKGTVGGISYLLLDLLRPRTDSSFGTSSRQINLWLSSPENSFRWISSLSFDAIGSERVSGWKPSHHQYHHRHNNQMESSRRWIDCFRSGSILYLLSVPVIHSRLGHQHSDRMRGKTGYRVYSSM